MRADDLLSEINSNAFATVLASCMKTISPPLVTSTRGSFLYPNHEDNLLAEWQIDSYLMSQ